MHTYTTLKFQSKTQENTQVSHCILANLKLHIWQEKKLKKNNTLGLFKSTLDDECFQLIKEECCVY